MSKVKTDIIKSLRDRVNFSQAEIKNLTARIEELKSDVLQCQNLIMELSAGVLL